MRPSCIAAGDLYCSYGGFYEIHMNSEYEFRYPNFRFQTSSEPHANFIQIFIKVDLIFHFLVD